MKEVWRRAYGRDWIEHGPGPVFPCHVLEEPPCGLCLKFGWCEDLQAEGMCGDCWWLRTYEAPRQKKNDGMEII